MRASTCENYEVGTVVYRFVRLVMDRPEAERKRPVLDDLSNPVVSELVALEKHAVNESERMRQFVRFNHLENGVWFARCNPNASVIPLVMSYFAARLNDQPFIIWDERHLVAGVYDGRDWSLVSGDAVNVPSATVEDALMEEAWKRFYDALSIDVRYHPELRRQFMPVRLWRNLPEMKPRRDVAQAQGFPAASKRRVAVSVNQLNDAPEEPGPCITSDTISHRLATVAQR